MANSGVQIVVATVDLPNGQGYVSTLVFDIVDFDPADVKIGSIEATVAAFDLDENATNEETMEAYFGGSIASFTT
ncbi:MAG: hypothetical protein IH891_07520, partial [Planctomycetes bacterium]|nr:hypothetical protein [Planctomycetota bacterium]